MKGKKTKKMKKQHIDNKSKKTKKMKKQHIDNKSKKTKKDNTKEMEFLDDKRKPIEKFKEVKEPVNWGLGVEHEMHLFHKPTSGMKDANIVFDSQESSCFLTGDKDPQGACKKLRKKPYFNPPKKIVDMLLSMNNDTLTDEEIDLVEYLDWELSGRQISNCNFPMLLPRIKVLMPELVTGNFKNRSIDSINEEIGYLEKLFIDLHMKNPIVKEKVKKYGKLVTHLCGSHNNIKVPIRPTIYSNDYKFNQDEKPQKDYLGSYHITLTLPHRPDISKKQFINMHRDMANQFQWIEPLLVAAFFSPDMDSVGSSNNPKVKGSFRIMSVGWGNFGGSDVRKFGTEGISRGANIKTYWRDTVKFKTDLDEDLNYCIKTSKPTYKRSKSILNSDFRTFNFEHDDDKCEKLYTSYDCPKADGGLMEPPYGMEIRVFDHFPQEYLIEMLRIITLLGGNAIRHPPTEYVYKDKRWINALKKVMFNGWNAEMSDSYLNVLRKNLGLPISMPVYKSYDRSQRSNSRLALDVLKQIVKELFELNKHSMINQLMNEHPDIEPTVPSLNRMCWELKCNADWNSKLVNLLKNIKKEKGITAKKTKIHKNVFIKYLFESNDFGRRKWSRDIDDLLYTLESYKKIELVYDKYHISHFRILI